MLVSYKLVTGESAHAGFRYSGIRTHSGPRAGPETGLEHARCVLRPCVYRRTQRAPAHHLTTYCVAGTLLLRSPLFSVVTRGGCAYHPTSRSPCRDVGTGQTFEPRMGLTRWRMRAIFALLGGNCW